MTNDDENTFISEVLRQSPDDKVIVAYKAFDKDLTYRGYRYEVGETYRNDGKGITVGSGFCSFYNPLGVLSNQDITTCRLTRVAVSVSDVIEVSDVDTRILSASITIQKELSVGEYIETCVEWILTNCNSANNVARGDSKEAAAMGVDSKSMSNGPLSTAAASGNNSTAASVGCCSNAASSGDYATALSSGKETSAASGGYCAKCATVGDNSNTAASGKFASAEAVGADTRAATSGESSTAAAVGTNARAATSGDFSWARTRGARSKAASCGDMSTAVAVGNNVRAVAIGDYAKSEANGVNSIAMVAGLNGSARAGNNGAFAIPWKDGKQIRIAVGVVGYNVKEDTLYIVKNGALQEVK